MLARTVVTSCFFYAFPFAKRVSCCAQIYNKSRIPLAMVCLEGGLTFSRKGPPRAIMPAHVRSHPSFQGLGSEQRGGLRSIRRCYACPSDSALSAALRTLLYPPKTVTPAFVPSRVVLSLCDCLSPAEMGSVSLPWNLEPVTVLNKVMLRDF